MASSTEKATHKKIQFYQMISKQNQLQNVREDIDALDLRIIECFSQRQEYANRVATIKKHHAMATLDPQREFDLLLSRICSCAQLWPIEGHFHLWREVLSCSLIQQNPEWRLYLHQGLTATMYAQASAFVGVGMSRSSFAAWDDLSHIKRESSIIAVPLSTLFLSYAWSNQFSIYTLLPIDFNILKQDVEILTQNMNQKLPQQENFKITSAQASKVCALMLPKQEQKARFSLLLPRNDKEQRREIKDAACLAFSSHESLDPGAQDKEYFHAGGCHFIPTFTERV